MLNVSCGSSALPEDLARRFIDRYNVAFVIESARRSTVDWRPADAPEDQYRTCGRPLPHAASIDAMYGAGRKG